MTKTKAQQEAFYGADVPELIQMCLECRRVRCNDCITQMSSREKLEIIEQRKQEEKELCSTELFCRDD